MITKKDIICLNLNNLILNNKEFLEIILADQLKFYNDDSRILLVSYTCVTRIRVTHFHLRPNLNTSLQIQIVQPY